MTIKENIVAVYLKFLTSEHEALKEKKDLTGLTWENYVLSLAGLKKRGEK